MDNSQTSDMFSESLSDTSMEFMDVNIYEKLISETKTTLSRIVHEGESTPNKYNGTVLDDCLKCVCRGLEIMVNLLDTPNTEVNKLSHYLLEIIGILQLISNLLANITESISMSCEELRIYSSIPGQILFTVFSHCKESENLYGTHLSLVQKELKDLFRASHELQLIYLKILEKQIVFDLSNAEEQDVLVEVLEINLKIGIVVESLDLKTMAEQWKAYSLLCEKYSKTLVYRNMLENCTNGLIELIINNIYLALEDNQDQKIVLRSLKVSNFILKILMKICLIFKNTESNYDKIVKFLIFIKQNSIANLLFMKVPHQLIQNINANILTAADALITELVSDKGFVKCFLQYDIKNSPEEDSILGYILLLVSIIKVNLQRNDATLSLLWFNVESWNLISGIFKALPYCHMHFNLTLKFSSPRKSNESCGLYEHVLTYWAALATTFELEQYEFLEKEMLKAILGTDCCASMFAVDLWTILSRVSEPNLCFNQLKYLCQIYIKLDKKEAFKYSLQQVHLSRLIESLYSTIEKDGKILLYRQIGINKDSSSLWTVLKVRSLSGDSLKSAEENVIGNVKSKLGTITSSQQLTSEDVDEVIKAMRLASTCSYLKMDCLEDEVLKAWDKICTKSNRMKFLSKDVDQGDVWLFELYKTLVALTETMIPILQRNSAGLLKVLHVISSILATDNAECKLLLFKILFKLSLYNPDQFQKTRTDTMFLDVYKAMLKESDFTVKNKMYDTVKLYMSNSRVKEMISKAVNEDSDLAREWNYFLEHRKLPVTDMAWKDQLKITSSLSYTHKCFKKSIQTENSVAAFLNNSKDFESFDSIGSFSEEPSVKKAKLETDELDSVLSKLENDVLQLSRMKENIRHEYRNRISQICEQLQNLIE